MWLNLLIRLIPSYGLKKAKIVDLTLSVISNDFNEIPKFLSDQFSMAL